MKQTSCIVVLTLLKVVLPLSRNYEYSLQTNPITIASNPKSQVVYSEENFTLTCIASLSSKSEVLVDWRFNNQGIDRNYSSSNRSFNSITSSLNRPNASQKDSGYYECLILDGVDPLGNSAMVTVSKKAYIRVVDHHLKDKATEIFIVTLGANITRSCGLNLTDYSDVTWLKDGWQAPSLNVLASGALKITDMSIDDEGVYHCSSSLAEDQLTSTLLVNKESIDRPQISDTSRLTETYTSLFEIGLDLVYPVIDNGSRLMYTWYKNGVELTASRNAGREWTYFPSSPGAGAIAGIYQCFVHNIAGSDFSITRVLERGFSNPPENLTCVSMDQTSNPELPKIVLHWDPPTLNTNTVTKYDLEYGDQKFTTNTTTFEINLDDDSFFVRVNVSVSNQYSKVSKDGTKEDCYLDDTLGRRQSPANARKLGVTCPNSTTGGRIEWDNPGLAYSPTTGLGIIVGYYHLQCICLHGTSVKVCANVSRPGLEIEIKTVEVEVDKMVPGSLCLFGGEYYFEYFESTILKFPLEMCAVPPVYADQRLNVTCGETGIILHIFWKLFQDNSSIGIHMEGNCLKDNFDAVSIFYNNEVSFPTSELNIDGSAIFSVCSFSVVIMESSGNSTYDLQCALEGAFFLPPPVLQNETITDRLEEYDTTSELSPFNTTTGTENGKRIYTTVLSLFTAAAVVASITIVVVMLAFYRRWSEGNNWHKREFTSSFAGVSTFAEPNVSEMVKVDCTDATSLRSDVTVLDCLNKEKQLYSEFFSERYRTDLQSSHCADTLWHSHIPIMDFDEYFCDTQSSGYDTASGACYETRDYYIARDMGLK